MDVRKYTILSQKGLFISPCSFFCFMIVVWSSWYFYCNVLCVPLISLWSEKMLMYASGYLLWSGSQIFPLPGSSTSWSFLQFNIYIQIIINNRVVSLASSRIGQRSTICLRMFNGRSGSVKCLSKGHPMFLPVGHLQGLKRCLSQAPEDVQERRLTEPDVSAAWASSGAWERPLSRFRQAPF